MFLFDCLQLTTVGTRTEEVGVSVARSASDVSGKISLHSQMENEEEEIVKFAEIPNRKLFCLLCSKVFIDPVIVSCGVRKMYLLGFNNSY